MQRNLILTKPQGNENFLWSALQLKPCGGFSVKRGTLQKALNTYIFQLYGTTHFHVKQLNNNPDCH